MRRTLSLSILLLAASCTPLLAAAPALATPNFDPPINFASGPNPAAVAVADLTSGGELDIVTANSGSATGNQHGISVLANATTPGDANPSFAAPLGFNAGPHPSALALGDLNGDLINIVVVANGGAAGANGVSVLLKNRDRPPATPRTSSGPTNFTAGANPASVALADINRDGDDLSDRQQGQQPAPTASRYCSTRPRFSPRPRASAAPSTSTPAPARHRSRSAGSLTHPPERRSTSSPPTAAARAPMVSRCSRTRPRRGRALRASAPLRSRRRGEPRVGDDHLRQRRWCGHRGCQLGQQRRRRRLGAAQHRPPRPPAHRPSVAPTTSTPTPTRRR